ETRKKIRRSSSIPCLRQTLEKDLRCPSNLRIYQMAPLKLFSVSFLVLSVTQGQRNPCHDHLSVFVEERRHHSTSRALVNEEESRPASVSSPSVSVVPY
ncbi:unnamed protein product, partial [Linum tenue]